MFSGIVEAQAHIQNIKEQNQCKHFAIALNAMWPDLHIGDSVAINGICLTVTSIDQNIFFVTAVPETLRLTNLNQLREKDSVNVERSIRADARIGGHFVQGHVDGMAEILSISMEGDAWLVMFSLPEQLRRYVVNKGFIAIDGMSITVIEVLSDRFSVTFIPHTIQTTLVQFYRVGTFVNLEVDMLAKYVEKILGVNHDASC